MCGIAGYFNFEPGYRHDPELLISMAEKLRHRGPDADGIFSDSSAGLTFRRLSLLDLDGGNQPIFNEDHSIVLVCNGEIFNYQALRADLIKNGHRFRTNGDIEVLAHLYEDYGPAMLRLLNGQFALALYDRKQKLLLLARDHAGIAPLCYASTGKFLIFGSEIKAILECHDIPRKVDLTGLDQVFTFPGIVSPRTMFEGISRLEPGHYLVVSECGIQDIEYWDLDYPRSGDREDGTSEQQYIEGLRHELCRSIRYRLQADVEVGFYLSGGLDSSLIAAFLDNIDSSVRRQAFSITFQDPRADESKYQKLIAQQVNCDIHTTYFNPEHTAQVMHAMVYHAECPVKESYNACALELSRCAQRHNVKAVLTGEGADELFAGYVGYRCDRARIEGKMAQATLKDSVCEAEFRQRLFGDSAIHYEQQYGSHWRERKQIYSLALRHNFREFDCLNHNPIRKERLEGRHPLDQRSYLDFKLRMSDHLLMDHGDAMAFANSVEARYPFLDPGFIEYAKRIPPELKLHGYTEKYILRKIGENLLPPRITKRQKFGWYAPGSPELLQKGVPWIHQMLDPSTIRRQGYFDPNRVEELKTSYSRRGFQLNNQLETDWLIIVATFGLFKEIFKMPDLA